MQGGTNSSEFRIPDSELGGSLKLRVPEPQPSRLTPMPPDKILFPRRMLYVEGVLYATLAVAAFGLGYLAGRGGSSAATKPDAELVPVEGRVSLLPGTSGMRDDAGAVVIVLPAGKLPAKLLPTAGLRPGEGYAPPAALTEFGGAAARTDRSGAFTLLVPAAGSYHVLMLSHPGTREPAPADQVELAKYFAAPAELLKGCRYRWLKDVRIGTGSIDVQFSE